MLSAQHPFSLILFGASGHLARIKIFPALYVLALKKRLPKDYAIVGYARTALDDATFRKDFAEAVKVAMLEVNEKVLEDLLNHVHYQPGQYDQGKDFASLASRLQTIEKGWKDAVRLAYLSIPPDLFATVVKNMSDAKVHRHEEGKQSDFRCIVEKPVGSDYKSFTVVRDQLYSSFDPGEVFILDHYLGKEAVRNVYYLRLANPVIERLLKNSAITNVQITAAEVVGLEGRAGYFDSVGTLRDMFQSHLLQIGALLTMRLITEEATLKAARLHALEQFYLPPGDMESLIVQGQYGGGKIGGSIVSAYRDEKGIRKDSRAATFAIVKLMSRSSRWEGVPFFLRSGKRLKAKETKISIEFQDSPVTIGRNMHRNQLDIILQGEAGMKFSLQTKLGGSEPQFRPLILEDPLVCMGDCLVEHALLLLEAINGNQQWFLDPKEVSASWNLIDPLQQYLNKKDTPLSLYTSGSTGPKEADGFAERHGFTWF